MKECNVIVDAMQNLKMDNYPESVLASGYPSNTIEFNLIAYLQLNIMCQTNDVIHTRFLNAFERDCIFSLDTGPRCKIKQKPLNFTEYRTKGMLCVETKVSTLVAVFFLKGTAYFHS